MLMWSMIYGGSCGLAGTFFLELSDLAVGLLQRETVLLAEQAQGINVPAAFEQRFHAVGQQAPG